MQSWIDGLNRKISELLQPSKSLRQVLRDWLEEAFGTERVGVEGQTPENL